MADAAVEVAVVGPCGSIPAYTLGDASWSISILRSASTRIASHEETPVARLGDTQPEGRARRGHVVARVRGTKSDAVQFGDAGRADGCFGPGGALILSLLCSSWLFVELETFVMMIAPAWEDALTVCRPKPRSVFVPGSPRRALGPVHSSAALVNLAAAHRFTDGNTPKMPQFGSFIGAPLPRPGRPAHTGCGRPRSDG